jgi:hypothetical protein
VIGGFEFIEQTKAGEDVGEQEAQEDDELCAFFMF